MATNPDGLRIAAANGDDAMFLEALHPDEEAEAERDVPRTHSRRERGTTAHPALPPDIVSYFTDPNATGPPPDMQLLLPFVESALPVAYGVLAIQLFHVSRITDLLSIYFLHSILVLDRKSVV